jgi:uncharacterized protein (DUF2147 family)
LRRLWLGVVLLFAGAIAARADAPDSSAPIGRWITANQSAVIQIAPCGNDLCGQIVGIALAHPGDPMPNDWQGHPQCGLTILKTSETDGQWVGVVQDPRNGSVYQAHMALDSNRHLVLHGYIGLPIFGQTQTWTPYSGRTMANCRLSARAFAANG